MEDHYGIADLRQFITNTSLFTSIPLPQPTENLSAAAHHYYVAAATPQLMHQDFVSASANNNLVPTAIVSGGGGVSTGGGGGFGGYELDRGGGGRWPRQETLTLLEIRSRLDFKFKEANQKGPLWDEVSRIMSEEHGYTRSGKKCREKFENLYKYYKKTKDGKSARQDGKHYRFFRQLEALYGNNNQPPNNTYNYCYNDNNNNNSRSLSLSSSSGFETTSSEKREGRWKEKIKGFIDEEMKKAMEKQEAWWERAMVKIESKERERVMREEEWRRLEGSRRERERKMWARERAWVESRNASLAKALHRFSSLIQKNNNINNDSVGERANVEYSRFRDEHPQQFVGCSSSSEDVVWEEIANKMCCLGYDNNGNNINGAMCRDKWININNNLNNNNNNNNKRFRKDNTNSGNCCFDYNDHHEIQNNNNDHHHHQNGVGYTSSSHGGFRFLMGENNSNSNNSNSNNAENCLWESYVLKASKGGEI